VVLVQAYAIKIHLPPSRPQGAPFLRVYINDGAQHVATVLGAPATLAKVGDAGCASVAATCTGEYGRGVDVLVVQQVAGRMRGGEWCWSRVHTRDLWR
jgi:hypothetical protein